MDQSSKSHAGNEDLIPCECGCGQFIKKYGADGRQRRFVRGHQFYGNQYGQKAYDLNAILTQAETICPLCLCGCGEKLDIPNFLRTKGRGLQSIQSYWKRHPYKKGHGLWDLRTEKLISNVPQLEDRILGVIYGTLLGDGSIDYPNKNSRFPRLRWTHSDKQEEWLAYKAQCLVSLSPKLRSVVNQGYGNRSICCQTQCHPELIPIFNTVKPDGKQKTVTQHWLNHITLEGLSWWYMDDGSISFSSSGSPFIQLHTEGFSYEENQLIAQWLTNLGYPAEAKSYVRKSSEKSYYYIKMGATSSRKWLSDLQQFSVPSMAYKFRDH